MFDLRHIGPADLASLWIVRLCCRCVILVRFVLLESRDTNVRVISTNQPNHIEPNRLDYQLLSGLIWATHDGQSSQCAASRLKTRQCFRMSAFTNSLAY